MITRNKNWIKSIAPVLAVSTAVLGSVFVAQTINAQEKLRCDTNNWVETSDGLNILEGCLKADGKEHKFTSIAFNITFNKLGLVGSGPNGQTPTDKDVETYNQAASRDAGGNYSLKEFIESPRAKGVKVATTIGYPVALDDFVPSGLFRIDQEEVAERDLVSTFKSALFCLNEAGRNKSGGSRVIVFNAFESGSPVRINDRVADEENCPDVAQIGPRIVEYRGKPGIKRGELRTTPQSWLVFSQGEGPTQHGYITFFEDPINMYHIQELMLEPSELSPFDGNMRVVVALTTGQHSAIAVKNVDRSTTETKGKVDIPHPIFLTVQDAN